MKPTGTVTTSVGSTAASGSSETSTASHVAPAEGPLDPEALVGRRIRRVTRTATRFTQWARIVMTVPSRDGLCWLVDLSDGDVDVWRIDDSDARYQLAPLPLGDEGADRDRPGH